MAMSRFEQAAANTAKASKLEPVTQQQPTMTETKKGDKKSAAGSPQGQASSAVQEFLNMYRQTTLQLLTAVQLQQERGSTPLSPAVDVPFNRFTEEAFPSPCSTDSNCDYHSTVEGVSPVDVLCNLTDSSSISSSCCYADSEPLQAGVDTLRKQLLRRCPLTSGRDLDDIWQRFAVLQKEVLSLEAQSLNKRLSGPDRRAAKLKLNTLIDCKVIEADLVCTLLEQQEAAEDLTSGGATAFKKSWREMWKLEGRVHSLKKQLATKHGIKISLAKFPYEAADAVLVLASMYDAQRKRYRSWTWKMLQHVNAEIVQSKKQLLLGLKKSKTLPSSLLKKRLAVGTCSSKPSKTGSERQLPVASQLAKPRLTK